VTHAGVQFGFVPDVAVFEDDEKCVAEITAELYTFGSSVEVAANYESFFRTIGDKEFDALSVDWYIGSSEKGREALLLAARKQPNAVRVVLTHHVTRTEEAKALAEVVLLKGSMEEYRTAMRDASALGRARRIASELCSLGIQEASELKLGFPLDIEEEVRLQLLGRDALSRFVSRNQSYGRLRTLLSTRGWWRTFDSASYISLSRIQKLLTLASYVGLTAEDIGEIAGIQIPSKRVVDISHPTVESKLVDSGHVDHLLSILGYVLRLASYEPELMPGSWEAQCFFADSVQPPPWDPYGLCKFIRMGGPHAIEAAIEWIRSH
jgi:hypothetical protein